MESASSLLFMPTEVPGQGAPCLSLDRSATSLTADSATQRPGAQRGRLAGQAIGSPASLIDDDCLRVLVAHFLVKPFHESCTDPGIGVSQSA